MTVAAALWGAAVGAGTAKAMGGDPKKGAMYGAVGGGIGGAAAPAGGITQASIAGQAVSPATFGAVAGGAVGGIGSTMIKPSPLGGSTLIPQTPPPSPMTVGFASEAEKQRRKRRRGYGSTLLAGGELGVATTHRKQILG